jgi:divalent metal cation (Fe/Co/Zn/Cd) transporter
VLFTLGGLFALYEGYHKIADPHPIERWYIAVAVLLIAIGLETFSFRTAIVESNKVRSKQSWAEFVRHAKAPELPVVLLEDFGALIGLILALIGVGLAVWTDNGVWDGIGTLGIGLLLVVIAAVLAVEMKSLLLGEAATPVAQERIKAALMSQPGVESIIHIRTMHLGPDELLVAAKIGVVATSSAADVAATIDAAEAAVRAVEPLATAMYLEPDIYREDVVEDSVNG